MFQYSRCYSFSLFILLSLLVISSVCTAKESQKGIISFSEPLKPLSKQIDWKLQPLQTGLKCSITLNLPTPKQPEGLQGKIVGEYRIEIDGMIMKQDFFDKPVATLECILPFATIANGEHSIFLEVRDFAGKAYSQKRSFTLNALPEITVASQAKDENIFDPVLSFSFWGDQDGLVGMVDIFLDERPWQSFALKSEQNKKQRRLSELTGKKLYTADLQPGNHLLKIIASNTNGASSTLFLPVIVQIRPPVIAVNRSNKKAVDSIEIQFPPTANQMTGTVDIYSKQSIVFSVQAKELKLSISRADLLAAMKKNNQSTDQASITLVIATRAANQVENWQELLFQ